MVQKPNWASTGRPDGAGHLDWSAMAEGAIDDLIDAVDELPTGTDVEQAIAFATSPLAHVAFSDEEADTYPWGTPVLILEDPSEILWADDFARADGPLGTTPAGGLAWQLSPSGVTAGVVSGEGKFTGGPSGAKFAWVDAGERDGRFTITVTSRGAANYGGVIARFADASNRITLARVSGSNPNWQLSRRVGGAATQLATFPGVHGDVFVIVCDDDKLTVVRNEVEVWSGTDTSTGTGFGFYTGLDIDPRFDDAEFRTLG